MRSTIAGLMLSAVVCSLTVPLAQADSGPKKDAKLPALKVHVVTGDGAGKEVDMSAERKKGAAIFLFVAADKFDRPTARFMKELDQELIKQDRRDIQIVAVWLTDDAAKSKDYLPRAQQSLQLSQTTWTVFPGDKTGPADWGLDADRIITVVAAQDGVVLESSPYDSINETVVASVLQLFKKK